MDNARAQRTAQTSRWRATVTSCLVVTLIALGSIAFAGSHGISCPDSYPRPPGCDALPRRLAGLVSGAVVAVAFVAALASARRRSPLGWADVIARPTALSLLGLVGYAVTANARTIW